MLMQQVSNTYGNSMGWLNASNTRHRSDCLLPAGIGAANA